MKISLAQINPTVGDLDGNAARIRAAYKKAAEQDADLVVFSELALVGYPPEDLVLRERFQQAAMKAMDALATETKGGPAMLVGGLWHDGQSLYNTAFLLDGGKIVHRQPKVILPNYGVFDEKRVFAPGGIPNIVKCRGVNLGILVCEDIWGSALPKHLAAKGAQILIATNASPFEMGKAKRRREVCANRVQETGLPVIYVNQAGGQDELVFDGRSFVLNHEGGVQVKLPAFEEAQALTEWTLTQGKWHCAPQPLPALLSEEETIWRAMVLGLRDYVNKNNFPGVVLGLSGGIDSAVCAAVAVDALGAERVRGMMMPSPYTSQESLDDAAACASKLGIRLDTIAIAPGMQAMDGMLKDLFVGKPKDVTEENIQSRLRGLTLMAISNKEGLMVLTTGNKSEMSVGYATLYGDMCGGYSVLKDVYKIMVYRLAKWRNAKSAAIPERTITRAPTAELKPDQTDQDTLPPYDVLDAILQMLVEDQKSVEEIVAGGQDSATVSRVARMLYAAEYKRRQAPPGVKISGMAFGRDRRYPITNGWKS